MSLDLYLITRQKANIENVFANNMSTDIKLSKAQLSKIIQSVKLLGKMLGNNMDNLHKRYY